MIGSRIVRNRRASLSAAAAASALGVAVVMVSPAAAARGASASVASDTLTVTGTNADELLALRLAAGAPGMLQVDFGDDGLADFTFDRSTFSRIAVFVGGGNDRFSVDQVNGNIADETLTVDGGNGDDDLSGGNGAEIFIGGNGSDKVDGNGGSDTGFLGNGTDSFRWDPGDGSDIVEGENGVDTLDFRGAPGDETMRLTPNGTRSLFLRVQANIRMDMDGVERLDLTALEGIDNITIDDMSGTDFRQAKVNLSAAAGGGDGASDNVTVNGSTNADQIHVGSDGTEVDLKGLSTEVRLTGSETRDSLKINALDGDDAVRVDGTVGELISPTVDLGAGQS